MIFGLVAICVAAPFNEDQRTADGDYLTLGSAHRFVINDSWGRHDLFEAATKSVDMPSVAMDFGDWMPPGLS